MMTMLRLWCLNQNAVFLLASEGIKVGGKGRDRGKIGVVEDMECGSGNGNATRFRTAHFGDPPALELLSIEDPEASTDDEDSKTCLHIGICFSTEMQNERASD